MSLTVDAHPLLESYAFLTRFQGPLEACPSPPDILSYFAVGAQAPLATGPEVKAAVRDLLRQGGFKPTGRNKPASEYLIKAIEKGWFTPEKGINLAVDACNVASLHSGLPISVVDATKAERPWNLSVMPQGTEYVFNPAGQVIDIGGLVVLSDASGPCGAPVKDSQRTKTHEGTTQTLSIIWGTSDLPGRTEATARWYREMLHSAGAVTEEVAVQPRE